jgi:DNA mismatch endonuclease (patch repair protein)
MSRIRCGDTKPELAVRSTLHRMGYRFRLKNRNLPGRPDIILPRFSAVIFVHGCFWHRHPDCRYAYTPKSRPEFWNRKFAKNVLRDRQVASDIEKIGWKQLTLWECEIKDEETTRKRLKAFLNGIKTPTR